MANALSRTLARLRRLDRQAVARSSRRLLHWLQGNDYVRPDGRCRHSPKWLVLGVNNVCNLHCKMCDVGLGENGTAFWANMIGPNPRNMTGALLQDILRQARAFLPRPQISMGSTEPLIHPEILEFTQAIVQQGFYCNIITNGTMLPRLATALVESGLHELTISVDGPAVVHNRIRGGRDSFEKLYRGAELLTAAKARLRRRYPKLQFSFTITDENYTHILEFVQAVEPLQPAAIHISHLSFITDDMAGVHNARYGGDLAVKRSNLGVMNPAAFDTGAIWAELQRVDAYVRSRGATLSPITISPSFTSREGVDTLYHEPLTLVSGPRCTDPWKMMMIRTDGTVVPGQDRCYNFPIGNVQTSVLAELWNNDRFRGFRQTLRRAGGTLPACARCCGVLSKPVLAGVAPAWATGATPRVGLDCEEPARVTTTRSTSGATDAYGECVSVPFSKTRAPRAR